MEEKDSKGFKCDIIPSRLTQKNKLKGHIESIHGGKTLGSLEKHIKSNNGGKIFKFVGSHSNFTKKDFLKKHIKSFHKEKCQIALILIFLIISI